MVHLEDLDVEILAEGLRHLADEPGQQVDPERHIAGLNDAGAGRRLAKLAGVGIGEARRADHVDDAGFRRKARQRDRGGRRREVDEAVRPFSDRARIVADRYHELGHARQEPGVLSEGDRARALEGADELAAVRLGDRLDEHAPHAPGRADHHQPHLSHPSVPAQDHDALRSARSKRVNRHQLQER